LVLVLRHSFEKRSILVSFVLHTVCILSYVNFLLGLLVCFVPKSCSSLS